MPVTTKAPESGPVNHAYLKLVEIMESQARLVRHLNKLLPPDRPVSRQAAQNWRSRPIPPEFVLALERVVQGQVTRYEMRPDVFGTGPVPIPKPPVAPTVMMPGQGSPLAVGAIDPALAA